MRLQIRTLLNRAQQAATQANSMVDFQQIDRAYIQYMISCDILLNLIPRHRDFPSMSNGSREWHRSYISIRKVSILCDFFSSRFFMNILRYQMSIKYDPRIRPIIRFDPQSESCKHHLSIMNITYLAQLCNGLCFLLYLLTGADI